MPFRWATGKETSLDLFFTLVVICAWVAWKLLVALVNLIVWLTREK